MRGQGSKAGWNLSEDSSNLAQPSFPKFHLTGPCKNSPIFCMEIPLSPVHIAIAWCILCHPTMHDVDDHLTSTRLYRLVYTCWLSPHPVQYLKLNPIMTATSSHRFSVSPLLSVLPARQSALELLTHSVLNLWLAGFKTAPIHIISTIWTLSNKQPCCPCLNSMRSTLSPRSVPGKQLVAASHLSQQCLKQT